MTRRVNQKGVVMRLRQNVGTGDRIIRIILGLALGAGLLAGALSAPLSYVVGVVAAIMLVTGATSFCPLYALFGFSTRRATGSSAPSLGR